ncbi:hypothetical protein N657DRAFT_679418 [Parathielavia appendiculata]|uniref:Uncharacterized protein n=1 Tax=Parathielavia appendiculata TaxID=2587402 RepID=A0AAN6U513_9PEZI|nr:hypothetical protein N657DRAFT_679418 [Parathielavia appendiculata]
MHSHGRLTNKNTTLQLLTLVTITALALLTPTVAAPVEATADDGVTNGGKTPAAAVAANYGTPHCKSAALLNLCTADNANAYCDATGFHCDFTASCKNVCWCE